MTNLRTSRAGRTRRVRQASAVLCLFVLAAAPWAAAQIPSPDKAEVSLAADRTAYEPGATARVAATVAIDAGWHVNAHEPTFEYLIPTRLDLELPDGWTEERLSYPRAKLQKFAFETEPLAVYDGEVVILTQVTVPETASEGAVPITATLSYQACNESQCLPPTTAQAALDLRVGAGGEAAGSAAGEPGSSGARPEPAMRGDRAGSGLALMLLLGLVGGLILNVMPCVLPVLSLKVFGMMRSAGHGRSEVVRGSLATAAGILASFWALGAAAVAARSAGAAVGWGVQFQRPGFVAFLAVVVVLFCLNLWGLFEIPLPARLARLGDSGPREGLAGHFASGLFATLMATPCSAPFLGTAVGFALAQTAPVILAIFTAVGLGMALPYLLLAAAPGTASRLLPRPGAWMESVRGIMGFLLAGAAVWLFYVLAAQVSPERLAAIQLALLLLALFTWVRHRAATTQAARHLAAAGMLAAIGGVLAMAAGTGVRLGLEPAAAAVETPGLIEWVAWDRAEAERLAAAGTLVFVDVTADWCFTCKVNERLVLETPEVAGAFAEHAVVPMKADWTNRNDEIASFLAEHGRYGIPFYLLYRPGAEPHVFSEILTKEGLIEEVRRGGERVAAGGLTRR